MSLIKNILRKGLLLNLELIDSARLVRQQVPGVLLSLPSQLWEHMHVPLCPDFCRDLNSGSHACTASTLTDKLSPQPQMIDPNIFR